MNTVWIWVLVVLGCMVLSVIAGGLFGSVFYDSHEVDEDDDIECDEISKIVPRDYR